MATRGKWKDMKPKKGDRITAWSMSRLRDWETCARQAFYKHVKKLKDQGSAAMDRGTGLHASAEEYVSNRKNEIAPDFVHSRKIKALADALRKEFKERRVRTELDLALNRKWQRCEWMDPNVYVRIKIDVLRLFPYKKTPKGGTLLAKEAHVIDWKSGKLREHGEYDDQLNQYATGALSAGYAESAKGQIAFIDQNVILERPKGCLTLDQLPAAQKAWDKRVLPMMEDTTFAPHPGNCKYCPFSINKEGPCDY